MKVLVHDYAGHPFQAGLSRELAQRGFEVIHAWFAEDAGPKGRLESSPSDPPTLRFMPISIGAAYSKTNLFRRRQGDLVYGRALAQVVEAERPDIVLSGNTPTEAQSALVAACRQARAAFVYWCQDFYSIAASSILKRKLPGLGHLVGAYYSALERSQMLAAEHVVLITEDFRGQTSAWGVPDERVSVIANWAALNELPLVEKANAWSRGAGLSAGPVTLYSGTLAMKHDPNLLLALARDGAATLVVAATGSGVDKLKVHADMLRPAMRIFPIQPFDALPHMLGAADVLVAMVERSAGEFSVPSKVLSYLCAGRPIVLAAPRRNLAAKILTDSGAGWVVEPEDTEGFVKAVRSFHLDSSVAKAAGAAGRRYAETHFDIAAITARFEAVFDRALARRS